MTGKDLIKLIQDNGLEDLHIDGECSGDHEIRFSVSLEVDADENYIWTDKVINLMTGEITTDTNLSDPDDIEILN